MRRIPPDGPAKLAAVLKLDAHGIGIAWPDLHAVLALVDSWAVPTPEPEPSKRWATDERYRAWLWKRVHGATDVEAVALARRPDVDPTHTTAAYILIGLRSAPTEGSDS